MNTILPLNADDFDNAFVIEELAHAYPWSKQTFLSNQGSHYLNLKLCLNNKIIGFIITQVITDEATLFNLAIHPDYQKQGLGKALLLSLIEQLKERHINTLWLEVRQSNHLAKALYHAIGFNEVTIRKNYYPIKQGHEDGVVMALYL